MEFQHHSVLSPSQIESARLIFKSFADTVVGNSPVPTHMGVLAVLQYLGTIGINKTENEVKDFILSITQPSGKQTSAASAASPTGSQSVTETALNVGPISRRTSSPSQASQISKGRKRSSKTPIPQVQMTPVQPPLDPTANTSLLLSFEHFLTLTLYTFDESSGGDCDKAKELRSTFNEFDVDRDGIVSIADLKNLLARHFSEPYQKVGATSPHSDLVNLSNAQLQAILAELDVGDDGIVSFEDFKAGIETS